MRIGTIKGTVAVCNAIGELEGSVKPLDILLEPAVLRSDGILIGKTEDLSEMEGHILHGKLLLGEVVDGVTVRDKFQGIAGEFFEVTESPAHGDHAGFKSPFGRNGMAENGFLDCIHNKPDVVIHSFDLHVGFVGGQIVGGIVVVVVNVSGDNGRSGVNLPCNHGMRNLDAMNIEKSTGGHPGRQAEIHHIGQAKTQNVGRELSELEVHIFPGHRG